MLRSALLRRTLTLVLTTLLVSALLTLLIYQGVSPRVFAANRSEEMLPKAKLIASLVEHEARGEITWGMLLTLLRNNAAQWDGYVWVVGSDGKTLISVQDGKQAYALPDSFHGVMEVVFSGEEATHIGRISALKPAGDPSRRSNIDVTKRLFGTQADAEATAPPPDTTFPQGADLVLVGVPIHYGEWVVGGVFMAQTMTEVVTGMRSLTNTLLISLLGGTLLMIPIAYIVSRRLARPMKQMRDVALAMAGGDFSARADASVRGEIGELGGALNYLSGELGSTISQLMMERTRLRRILNGLSEGIVAVDAQGQITHVNPAMRTLFRQGALPEGERNRLSVVPEQEVWAGYEAALAGGTQEVRTVRDGEASLRVSISPLEDEEGRIVGAVGVFRDVTQSERLEQTRRDYVANVSHELRTPLTALRALIEPLRDGLVQGEAERDRLYGVMLRETLRLSRLVNDMLELSRLQSGALSLEKCAFDAAHMLRDVYAKYAAHVEDHGQQLTLEMPEAGLAAVRGNHDRTEQVLVTLLDNAIKYTPEGGRIEIIAEPKADALHISVRDNGSGIAAADLPHVFDRFYKADKAHQGNGTGLGLAIAREILTLLGERIAVSSREGEGSAFTFTLHWDEVNLESTDGEVPPKDSQGRSESPWVVPTGTKYPEKH